MQKIYFGTLLVVWLCLVIAACAPIPVFAHDDKHDPAPVVNNINQHYLTQDIHSYLNKFDQGLAIESALSGLGFRMGVPSGRGEFGGSLGGYNSQVGFGFGGSWRPTGDLTLFNTAIGVDTGLNVKAWRLTGIHKW